MSMGESIVRALIVLLAGFCAERAFCRYLPPYQQWWRRAGVWVFFTITFRLPSWIGDENPILLFPFFLLAIGLFCRGAWPAKLVVGGIFYVLFISANMMLDSALHMALDSALASLVRLPFWCLLSLAAWKLAPPEGFSLPRRFWGLLGGLALAPAITTLSFSLWSNHYPNEAEYVFYKAVLWRFAYTLLPLVCLACLVLLYAARVLWRHEALERANSLAAQREIYYAALKQEQTQVRALRHDLRNHLTVLQGYLQQGNTACAQSYLAEMEDLPALSSRASYCGNEAVNVVLCSKAEQMEAKGHRPDFVAHCPAALPLPESELCALLGNALDNAIEAVGQADDKRVTLRAKAEKGLFMLCVENAFTGRRAEGFATTKPDRQNHGYGLAGMRDIAQKHGGSLQAEQSESEGRFVLTVCLPYAGDEAVGVNTAP